MSAFFKNLFKEAGSRDVITLFHNSQSASSVRVQTLLKQLRANAGATATPDQASEHPIESKTERTDFELDIQETLPTSDQLNSILEYVGPNQASSVVNDATGASDALLKFKASSSTFKRPIVVDWNNGRAVIGDDESEILKLVKSLPKK